MIKKILSFFSNILKTIFVGFCYDCLLLSKGFFFFCWLPFHLINKLFKNKIFVCIEKYFKERQDDSLSFLFVTLFFLLAMFMYTYLYNDSKVVYVKDSGSVEEVKDDEEGGKDTSNNSEVSKEISGTKMETNLYKKYGNTKIENINFSELHEVNNEVVAWLIVDGTNVNYPIVQTVDNDYYLNHNIKGETKVSGWTFMDFRNAKEMSDANTIFYGHNLLNKTGFGSLSNIFTDKWFKNSNHKIIVVTENKKYTYEIFSCYVIEPEVYYLQNNFNTNSEYQKFLDLLVSRSNYEFNVNLTTNDKIITLSTCTEDNKGRKVIHAKLID